MPNPRALATGLAVAMLATALAPAAAGLDVSAKAIRVAGSPTYSNTVQSYAAEVQGSPQEFDGSGVGIAVLDTGVDDEHPTFQGAFAAGAQVNTPCTSSEDCVQDEYPQESSPNCYNPDDEGGHGTHVASIALGRGGSDVGPRGVAPGADLIDVRVADSLGGSSAEAIRQGIEWVIEYNKGNAPCAPDPPASIISISMEGLQPHDSKEYDVAMEAVKKARDEGILVVAAAGNCGPDPGALGCPGNAGDEDTIMSPGAAPEALTVGAVDDHDSVRRAGDTVAPFSSRGPNPAEDPSEVEYRKPDVVAPGVDIVAACAAVGPAGDASDNGMDCEKNGTSMAVPHVAGLAAVLKQAHDSVRDGPPIDADGLEAAIRGTADDLGDEGWDKDTGYGYVDGYDAVVELVNHPPTSRLSYSPSNPAPGETVTFDASATTDPDGDEITRFRWTFPNGDTTNTTAPTVDRTFEDEGSYEVQVVAVDEHGTADPNPPSRTVEVAEEDVHTQNRPPDADLSLEPSSPHAGQEATLSAAGSSDPDDDAIVAYRWDLTPEEGFEPERVTEEPRIKIVFDGPGTKDFGVQVKDSAGNTNTARLTVTVDPAPSKPPVLNVTNPQEGDTVQAGEILASWTAENAVERFTVFVDSVNRTQLAERKVSLEVEPGEHTLRVLAEGPGGKDTDWANFTVAEPEAGDGDDATDGAGDADGPPGNASDEGLEQAEAEDESQAEAPLPPLAAPLAAALAAWAAVARSRRS